MKRTALIASFILIVCFASYSQDVSNTSQLDLTVRVYPNPVSDILMIQFEDASSETLFELNSMIGNRVNIVPEKIANGKYKIPVKNLATGYYFLIVKDQKRRFNKAIKFLKN